MKVNCLNCKEEFEARKSEVNRGNGKFCTISCASTHSNKKRKTEKEPNVKCGNCSKSFYKKPYRIKMSKTGFHFCSRKCKDEAQSIKGIEGFGLEHYGTGVTTYREKVRRERGLNECEKCGYDTHPEILEVHHKDRNRNNNELDNLIVLCPNCHIWEHYSFRDGRYKGK